MTPEAQRIAIAEACGLVRDWSYIRETFQQFKDRDDDGSAVFQLAKVPDYLSDLNAMHEAEKVRGWHDWDGSEDCEADHYFKYLLTICCQFPGFPTYCATAAQRAEAFLRTIGKWV